MNSHKIHSKNEDTALRWLCENAGNYSKQDEKEIELALTNLNCRKAKMVPFVDMLARVK